MMNFIAKLDGQKLREKHKFLAKVGVLAQRFIGNLLRNRRWLISTAKLSARSLVNIGCGRNILADFINIDYQWRPGVDICWDLRKSLPLRSESIEGIFTEHCLEHVDFDVCMKALSEFFRILKRDGRVRIVVPDAEMYIDLYSRSKRGEVVAFPYIGSNQSTLSERECQVGFSPIMAVNSIFRDHQHRFAYDFETLANMLRHVGFKKVERAAYGQGGARSLLVDSEWRAIESLYLEAIK